jgi:signal transduction histidine kinase
MIELFTLESLSILAEPSPKEIAEKDVRWGLEASRREANLFAEKSEKDVGWLLRAAEFAHDTGRYRESQVYSKLAIAASAKEDHRFLARALFFQCSNYLATSNGSMADRCAKHLTKLAANSADPCVLATHSLIKGMNRQYNVAHRKWRQMQPGAEYSLPLFEYSTATFTNSSDVDFAIRACLEMARARFELGNFFAGMDAIEQATTLACANQKWNLMGRIMVLAASNISDMGYRIGVEDVIRLALEWCDYLGDAWHRIETLTVLGRFLHYTMPPGEPRLAREPDRYLEVATKEAEALGASRLTASIDSTRFFLFKKAGDDRRVQLLLGDVSEEEEFRQKQLRDNRVEIEKIIEGRRQKTALRLHDGVEDTQDAFFVFDALRNSTGRCRDFCWAYVNRAAGRILEQSAAQVFLFSEARLLPYLSGLDDALFRAVDERESYEDVHEIEVEAETVWLHRRVVPSGDGAVVTLRNVTAEKSIETALRQAAESARQSESTKTAFLASMSHEIRTPLNGVLGLARMLGDTDMSPLQRSYVDDIVMSGNILLDLIGDVLDLSKIEAKEMQLSPSPVLLPPIVSSVVNLFHGQAEERGIGLHCEIDEDVPETVVVDAVRLRQILSNLVGNAIKFTDEGNVQIRVFADKRWVVFEVEDTGIGIPSGVIGEVFNRFRQVGQSGRGGTGLGLAITKALVSMMGGDVSVVSELGRGSRFTVRLPLQPSKAVFPEEGPTAPPRFDGLRVLVVDDNQINLLVSSHVIRKFGCETVCAKDGRDALELLSEHSFDLVFMDVQMPVLSGLEATREIRRREGGSNQTPVIALTAGALLQEQQACFEAGMDDFVTKPITLDSIQTILVKWLSPKDSGP